MSADRLKFGTVVLLLIATIIFLGMRNGIEQKPVSEPLPKLPREIAGWHSRDVPISQEVRNVLGQGEFLSRVYSGPGQAAPVELFVAYFATQRTGSTMHSPQNCLPGSGWVFVNLSRRPLHLQELGTIEVNESVITKGREKVLVTYWYEAHGRGIASEYMAKVYLVTDAIRLNRTDGALVRLITPILPGEAVDDARRRTLDLALGLDHGLKKVIPE